MSRWPRLFIVPIVLIGTAVAGPKLEEIPTYQLGIDALSSRLWEVAAARFEAALETEELDPEVRQAILLRLAESRIHGRQAAYALEVLAMDELKEHPERPFWSAQALAASGEFQKAIELIDAEVLKPKAPHRREALLTKSNLLRAIGDLDGALGSVEELMKTEPNSTSARLLKAELLLEQDRPEEALKILPDAKNLEGATTKKASLLRAEGLLATGKAKDAQDLFAALSESGEDQSITRYHAANLGLARARLALENPEAAADGLLAFIQKNPASSQIDSAFDLLIDCFPEKPAPNDPILTRLSEWIPPITLGQPSLVSRADGAAAAYPTPDAEKSPLAPEALFNRAIGLRREASADSLVKARKLLQRLRLEYPGHQLIARALLELGRWNLEDGQRAQAAACFDALERLGGESSPELRAQALTLEGTARFNEKDYDGAAILFDEAANLLESEQRDHAILNAATSLLAGSSLAGFDELTQNAEDPELKSSLALERALFLASSRDPGALPALRSFIEQNPEHPRLATARLYAALSALEAAPPDLEFADAQLGMLDDLSRSSLPQAPLALAEIRLKERSGDWSAAAARAEEFLSTYPDDPIRALILFEQGKALFQNKDYNDARLTLEKLAIDFPDSPQAPAALLLAARAAAEGATPQSQNESLALFDKLIDSESPFSDVARLEKADILIRLSRLDEAIEELSSWFKRCKDDHPLLLSIGLLLGDALYAEANGDPEILNQGLAVYDRLLKVTPENSPQHHRVLYQKGRTLQQFGDKESESKALIAYMDVVQGAAGKTMGDWNTIELCGFSALTILEAREEWRAAKKLAGRIAQLQGPRAQEAAERAKTLGMVHMIWEP